MSTEIIIAIISALVALVSALISIYSRSRTAKLEHQFARQLAEESREEKSRALIAKYRDPLMSSAYDLQSRLYSIVRLKFLRIYYFRSDRDKLYAINNTLYVIAEFLGWVEILRREVQFLDLGNLELNRKLGDLLANIRQAFLTDEYDLTFRLFRGEQRAIGEIMTTRSESKDLECIGFAEFSIKLNDANFEHWFLKLKTDIDNLATEKNKDCERRLIVLQHSLVELLEFLDPEKVRLPEQFRQRI